MFLEDDKLTITLIVENNYLKKHIIAFHNKIKLGKVLRIINSSFERYFKDILLLKYKGIILVNDESFSITK